MSYQTRRRKAASERGRRMAEKRWQNEDRRREQLAGMDPVKFPGAIMRRIVVIEREQVVREAVIYEFDSAREVRRKLRRVLTAP